jgi:hypothetical protein
VRPKSGNCLCLNYQFAVGRKTNCKKKKEAEIFLLASKEIILVEIK